MIIWMSTPRRDTGYRFRQLVGYDHVMISQELLDVLDKSRPLLFGSNIVALCVSELEQLRKSYGDRCLSLI